MKLIPHCLTAALKRIGIRSLIDVSNPVRPICQSVLYLRHETRDAAPKCISRRTSYLCVRLAFHPYPHLIRAFFNIHRFDPPRHFTAASIWTWVDHTVSGLIHAVMGRLIQTCFRSAFPAERVQLPRTLTRRLILQKARCHTYQVLQLLVGDTVSGTISLPSRGAFHLSLTVLVRYRWQRVFSLRRWSSQIPTRFLVSRGTRVSDRAHSIFGYGTLTPYGMPSQTFPLIVCVS